MKKFTIILLTAVAVIMVACHSTEPVPDGVTVQTQGETLIVGQGGQATVTVNSTTDWNATVAYQGTQKDWITINPASGTSGKTTLTIKVAANTDYSERKAIVTVTAGSASDSFVVSQSQNNGLQIGENQLVAFCRGDELDVEVRANVDVKVSNDADWITTWVTVSNSRGLESIQYTLSVAPNNTGKERTATVGFSGEGLSESVTVVQGYIPDIQITPTTFTKGSAGGDIEIEVTATDQYTFESDADWITPKEGDTPQKRLFTVEPFDAVVSREATITFTMGDSVRMASVVQSAAQPRLKIKPTEKALTANGGGFEVDVDTNVAFDISFSKSCDWVEQVYPDDAVNDRVYFQAKANTMATERSGDVVFSAGELSQTLHVTQAADKKRITVSPSDIIARSAGERLTIEVAANFDYQLSLVDAQGWLEQVAVNGADVNVLYFDVAANTLAKSRKASIVFTDGTDRLATVTVTQSAATAALTLTPDNFTLGVEGGECETVVAANFDYTATTTNDWITDLTVANGKVRFKVASSDLRVARSGVVTVKGTNNESEATISVKQAANEYIEVSQGVFDVPAVGGEFSVDVDSNFDWLLTESTEQWISIKSTTDKKITFAVAPNTYAASRSTSMIVKHPSVGELKCTVVVNQAAAAKRLSLSATALSFEAEGSTQSINVSANFDYSVASAGVDWLTINRQGDRFTFVVAANQAVESRSTIVSFYNAASDCQLSQNLTITQKAAGMVFSVSPASVNFEARGGEAALSVSANVEYQMLDISVDWLSLTSLGSGRYTLTAQPNSVAKSRSTTVELFREPNGVTLSVAVSQAAAERTMAVEPAQMSFSKLGESKSLTITANFDYTFVKRSGDWISLVSNRNTHTLTAVANPTVAQREAVFEIVDMDAKVVSTYSVTQQAGDATLAIDTTAKSVEAQGASFDVAVTSNTSFTAVASVDWITCSTAADKVNVVVAANALAAQRKGSVTVKTADGSRTENFAVEQKAAEKSVSVNKSKFTVAAVAAADLSIDVQANFEVEASSDSEWIVVRRNLQSQIVFDVAANPTYTSRTGHLTIGDLQKSVTVEIVQAQLDFIQAEGASIGYQGGEVTVEVEHNVAFETEIVDQQAREWLTIKSVEKSGANSQVRFTVAANQGAARQGDVRFYNAALGVESSVKIVQYGSTITVADPVFMKYLLDNFDLNNDGLLSIVEADAITAVDITDLGVETLEGIAQFVNLVKLNCSGNYLGTTVTFADVPMLTELICKNCNIEVLNVLKNTRLTTLDASNNNIKSLSLYNNVRLSSVNLSSNRLVSLDVSNCARLSSLDVHGNSLTNITLHPSARTLTWLDISNNNIMGLPNTNSHIVDTTGAMAEYSLDLRTMSKTILKIKAKGNANLRSIILSLDVDEATKDRARTNQLVERDDQTNISWYVQISGGAS